MELENIVANTVYLKARESEMSKKGGRSKKWKKMLELPPVKTIGHIKEEIPLTLDYIYNKQPIGKILFRQFCKVDQVTNINDPAETANTTTGDPRTRYVKFLDSKDEFDLANIEDKYSLGLKILGKYLVISSSDYVFKTENGLNPVQNDPPKEPVLENMESLKELTSDQIVQLLNHGSKLVFERLSLAPFHQFLLSKYFERYLQFKYLEKRPVELADFRMFRVLGKGGFGEVNACQHRSTGKMYACKTMLKKRIKKKHAQRMTLDEKMILQKIDSRFVVSLAYAFQAKDALCLILSLMNGGDLKFHLQTMIEVRSSQSFLQSMGEKLTPVTNHDNGLDKNMLNPEDALATPERRSLSSLNSLRKNSVMSSISSFLNPSSRHSSLPSNATKNDQVVKENHKEGKLNSKKSNESVPKSGKSSTISKNRANYTFPGPGGFDLDRARFYAAEIASGLIHMHKNGILYRDLKPENILLDHEGHLRISDLGLAVHSSPDLPVKGKVGTVGYMAPEILLDQEYSFPVDWWSMGCLVYEMIDGKSPFRGYKEKANKSEINKRSIRDLEIYFSHRFDPESKDICQKLLNKAPESRLGSKDETEEIISHPFFASHLNMAKLQAGKITPDFVPDPRAVYCKDILDIDQFSSVKGITFDENDAQFYKKFDTGAVSGPWQEEMIETQCFQELNIYSTKNPESADLNSSDEEIYNGKRWSKRSKIGNRAFLSRIFSRHNRKLTVSNNNPPKNSALNNTNNASTTIGHSDGNRVFWNKFFKFNICADES
ncbi:unnamed protein product [Gordionus sp. m RMFG-2023]|uniref:G protein-coupled receptor kinase 5-like n=1 Tax=Gordionus sp. m RMFG-2023 TaxID=3053472 RepID=UPI0030E17758